MMNDIEIAEAAKVKDIREIASKLGLTEDEIQMYGRYMAKVPLASLDKYKDKKDGKLVVVTAITPTPAGEGKTVTTIGLIQGLGKLGKNVVGALREPSIGPTFGIKGGATGGGYSQVYPMWDIDLHFTGDIHAVTAAHNLLSAIIDNELVRDNALNIDPTKVVLKKAMDINAPAGTIVSAVLDGTVVFTGFSEMKGQVVILQHDDNVVSVYANNSEALVETGETVEAGSPVAIVGSRPGEPERQFLHFELWRNGEETDPMEALAS